MNINTLEQLGYTVDNTRSADYTPEEALAEIDKIKAEINDLKAERKVAWNDGRRADYDHFNKGIRELNERIKILHDVYVLHNLD